MRTLLITVIALLAYALSPSAIRAQAPGAAPAAAPRPAAAAPQTPAAARPGEPATAAVSPAPFKDMKDKVSYALGMNLGMSLRMQSVEVDPQVLAQGLQDGLSGGKTQLTQEEVFATLRQLTTELRAKQEAKRKLLPEANRKEGAAFLAANKTKDGVVTLPDGLQYRILTAGTGPKPGPEDTVVCNYRGTLIDGTEFDSSTRHGGPATFPLNGVIKGWSEALQLMPVGSKWQLFIPSVLAYGERGMGDAIGPNATLVFEVELVSIRGKW